MTIEHKQLEELLQAGKQMLQRPNGDAAERLSAAIFRAEDSLPALLAERKRLREGLLAIHHDLQAVHADEMEAAGIPAMTLRSARSRVAALLAEQEATDEQR